MPRRFFVIVVLALIGASIVRAQQPAARQSSASALLRPDARAQLASADTLRPSRTRSVALPDAAYGRLDTESRVLRAAYRISARVEAGNPKAMARAYLREQAAAFGWDPELTHLQLDTARTGAGGSLHRIYRQTLVGVPVWRRHVVLSQQADGQPAMLVSGFRPVGTARTDFDPTPRLSAGEARAVARELVRQGNVRTSPPRLVAYPSDPIRLAWRLLAWPTAASAEWEMLIDAHSGAVIRVEDQTVRLGKEKQESGREETRKYPNPQTRPSTRPEGLGFAFDPDPLSTAGVTYNGEEGAPFNDGDDRSTAALRAERQQVTLQDLARDENGTYRLEGPHVSIVGKDASGDLVYTPPVSDTPDGFQFRRSESGFEAVSAYYHIEKSRRYAEERDFAGGGRGALRVNPQALEGDASRYFPGLHFLELGTGGVDDAEDGSVVWHEHAHALLEEAAPGLRATPEGQALHEGWADYWSAAYARHLAETGTIRRDDWRRLFKWDSGDGTIWTGRVVRHSGRYPQDTECDDSQSCNIYQDGLLWAATLMEIYDALGRRVTNHLALASHGYLAHPVTFRDAAEALLQADRALYDGAHLDALVKHLSERGLVESGAYSPTLSHDPLPSTEQTGGSVEVSVTATPVSSPVDTVRAVYGYENAPPSRTLLLQEQEGRHAGALPLPESPDTIRYFIEAIDAQGRRARRPAAPGSTYSFITGPDHTAPRITHTSSDDVALAAWPVSINAHIRDRLVLDSVGVRYEIEDAQGVVEATGSFGLEASGDDYYRGAFPVSTAQVAPGSHVRYQIYARDAAQAANAALQPENDWFTFRVEEKGLLRAYNFETPVPALQVEGTRFQDCPSCMWTRNRPSYGVQVARSGQRVIATAPDTSYAASAGRTALHLPALNLEGAPPAYLVFWHWYDFEHDGTATPEAPDTTRLWDGGNVKVSTDGGKTWSVAQPDGGYNGTIAEGTANPLGDQPGFGGYSHAWRRVVTPLPSERDVRVRLEAGFDATNEHASLAYAGWYVDDLIVTTEPPSDVHPPRVTEPPPSPLTRPPRMASVPVTVRASDDTGVEDAFAVYRFADAPPDTVRLDMSPAERNVFQGRLDPEHDPEIGDNLTYRLLLRDAGGRHTTYPAPGDPPLVVRYRNVQTTHALVGLTATGGWQPAERGWATELDDTASPTSSLLLRPVFVPDSTELVHFTLLHEHRFGNGAAGNVKVKPEGAQRWHVLAPEAGYGATFEPDTSHPMHGEPSFQTLDEGPATSTFNLAPYSGQRVQLRLDAGAAAPTAHSRWAVREAEFRFATDQERFRKPSRLALDPNYPDPFAQATTLDYAVPERNGGAPVQVRLTVYDALGRRVAVLVDGWQPPGTYTARFEPNGLSAGVYFARLRAGANQRVERMVIAR